jgi:DNA polymerase-3 subunit gamma/tau
VKFIFATTEPDKVLSTIRSRSHHYPFRLVPPGTMEQYMAELCASESVKVDHGVLPLVVRAGAGSVRDTESVLDQLMAGSVDGQVTYQGATALLGYTPSSLLERMLDAFAAGSGAEMFAVVDQVVESGLEPRRFAEDLLERLRDLLILTASGNQAQATLASVPAGELTSLRRQAERLGLPAVSAAADAVNDGLRAMMGATSPRLQLELLCARALLRLRGQQPTSAQWDGPQGVGANGAGGVQGAGSAKEAGRPSHPADAAPTGLQSAPDSTHPQTAGWSIPGVSTPPPNAAPPARQPGGSRPLAPPMPAPPPSSSPQPPSAPPARRPFVDWDEPDSAQPARPASASRPQTRPAAVPPGTRPAPQSPSRPSGLATGQEAQQPGPSLPPDAAGVPSSESSLDLATVKGRWDDVVAQLKTLSRAAGAMAAQDAFVVGVNGTTVTIGFHSPALASRFADQFRPALGQALSHVLGQGVEAQVQVDGRAAPGNAPGRGGPPEPTRTEPPAPQTASPSPPPTAPNTQPPATIQSVEAESEQAWEPPEPPDDAGDPGVRGLTGVPLIQEMLGGEIIEQTSTDD